MYRAHIPNFKAIGRYFKIGGIWGGGDFPPRRGTGEVSENGQNSSSSNVLEHRHIKFQENLTKLRDFRILGGESPPGGGKGNGGEFRNTEKGIR